MKRDPFTQMPQRIKDFLKSDEDLEIERQKIIEEAIQEYEAKKFFALEADKGK